MKQILSLLSNMKLAVFLTLIFAISVALATFIENDFGTETAQYEVFKSRWFEILLILLTLSLTTTFIKYKMYKFNKWFVSLSHLSFIIVAFGALITRYVGYEGVMHIREGDEQNFITSSENFINIYVDNNIVNSQVQLFSNISKNSFEFKNDNLEVSLLKFLPYVSTDVIETNDSSAKSQIDLMVSLGQNMPPKNISLWSGEKADLGFFSINFDIPEQNGSSDLRIKQNGNHLSLFAVDKNFSRMSMATSEIEIFENEVEILPRYLYSIINDEVSIVFKSIKFHVKEQEVSMINFPKNERERYPNKYIFNIKYKNIEKEVSIYGKAGNIGEIFETDFNGTKIGSSYGSQIIPLPFAIKLEDFVLERYAGSMSPSSYSSHVILKDSEENLSMQYHIYMNHVLDHRGYRFFQSSYDMDEGGSVLSVNFDPGTPITYLGYFLMFIGLAGSIFARDSRFQKLKKSLVVLFAILLFNNVELKAEKIEIEKTDLIFKFDKTHANKFGSLIVQDNGGRFKPLDSLNMDLLNKLSRSNDIAGLNHNQVILGMLLKPQLYKQIKMIYTADEKVNELLGVDKNEKRVSFEEFFEDPIMLDGYKLADVIEQAMRTPEKNRDKFQKSIIKVDERVNIAMMIYSGSLLKILPNRNDKNGGFVSIIDALQKFAPEQQEIVKTIIISYFSAIDQALISGNWNESNLALSHINKFQIIESQNSKLTIDEMRFNAEILYNKLDIFERLTVPTILIGVIVGILALISLITERTFNRSFITIQAFLLIIFTVFTAGLTLRWYVSGHAPWSDAYESLLYIGWASLLAGILSGRSSAFSLSATTILAGVILFVANLSWLDPQITNLVPVLKSYWLTIHVSLITASYGFLGLGAFLGLFSLLIFAIKTENNRERFNKKIAELNILNEMNLTIGLVLLTVGNFLGGVWANESWGRYWGWDPKESWALVTILIYMAILHTRFIPKVWGNYLFSLLSVVGFSSVIMTYFGVNFYLSGMHSYAQGDPVPVPVFVYYTIGGIALLSILAYRKRSL